MKNKNKYCIDPQSRTDSFGQFADVVAVKEERLDPVEPRQTRRQLRKVVVGQVQTPQRRGSARRPGRGALRRRHEERCGRIAGGAARRAGLWPAGAAPLVYSISDGGNASAQFKLHERNACSVTAWGRDGA